jgi:glycine/D-amino acid oxidase-like deaminating enzyme
VAVLTAEIEEMLLPLGGRPRIAIRPIPGDHLSAIGPVPRISGYYLAVTHSGVTMSPFLGAAVADEVVRGKQRRELADFRPARFFN